MYYIPLALVIGVSKACIVNSFSFWVHLARTQGMCVYVTMIWYLTCHLVSIMGVPELHIAVSCNFGSQTLYLRAFDHKTTLMHTARSCPFGVQLDHTHGTRASLNI